MFKIRGRCAAVGVAIGLTACGGGAGGGGAPPPPVVTPSPSPPATTGTVAFSIAIPAASGSARTRRPQHVSPATKSATVSYTAGGGAPQQTTVDCTIVCTGTLSVPTGPVTFVVTLRDGAGHVLSAGTAVQTIVAGSNTLSPPLGGVVASLTVTPSPASLPAGISRTIALVIVAKDAAGTTIAGSEPFVDATAKAAPLSIATTDNAANGGGRLVASAAAFAAPSDAIAVAYNGLATYGGTVAVGSAQASITVVPNVFEFAVPSATSGIGALAIGPDGNLWFVESGKKIGTMAPSGVVTEYPTHGNPGGIAAGPDGNLWITDNFNDVVVMTTGGAPVATYVVGDPNILQGIVAGPDGAMWFSEAHGIDRITTSGTLTRYSLDHGVTRPGAGPLVVGPDGNLWELESELGNIARVTTGGSITEFPTPLKLACFGTMGNGPDGALWFTEGAMNVIGRVTTAGVITEFPGAGPAGTCGTPFGGTDPVGIVTGPDGNLWYTEKGAGKIARMSTTGTITEFPVPSGTSSAPGFIIVGADRNLWFGEFGHGVIGKVVY